MGDVAITADSGADLTAGDLRRLKVRVGCVVASHCGAGAFGCALLASG